MRWPGSDENLTSGEGNLDRDQGHHSFAYEILVKMSKEHCAACTQTIHCCVNFQFPSQCIIIIMIINLIYIAQFDTNGILTALYIVIQDIQMQYVHIWTNMKQSYSYTYTCLHINTYSVTCTNIYQQTYKQDCPYSHQQMLSLPFAHIWQEGCHQCCIWEYKAKVLVNSAVIWHSHSTRDRCREHWWEVK